MNERLKNAGKGLRPAKAVPLRNRARLEGLAVQVNQPFRPSGEPVPSQFAGNRFSLPLPSEVKGPIRGREARKRKGVDGY